ncbi:hypothetical protein LOD99_13912 [Oopsacas minuta]|uniref:Uncharacterized protein n=1 Tax=Oopsacas minuta TaxID=111878 RepID=A0AAV7KID1_9METZ|nr:hypothetical protein LOD99_13912 [Oopsacas minuta]
MSALLFRSAMRGLCVTRPIKRGNVKPVTVVRHKWQSGDHIPSQEEQVTGIEKLEYDALMAGVQDPWNMEVPELGMASRANPNLVNSMFEERIIGCICKF